METLPSPNIPSNSFSSNLLDKDVHDIFFPLNLMSALVLHPKYRVNNNRITPNSVVVKILGVCMTALYICQHLHTFVGVALDENIRRFQPVGYLYYASGFDFLFVTGGFLMNCATNIIHSETNVGFVLTFQESHRFLSRNTSSKSFVIINWISVICIYGFFISACIYTYITYYHPPWGTLFHMMFLVTLDTDSVFACRLVLLLSQQFMQWNARVLELRDSGGDEDHCRNMYKSYAQILRCYKIYKKTLQLTILYKTSETILIGLVDIQILISFFKIIRPKDPHLVQVLIYAWTIKNLAIQTTLSVHLEQFYGIIKKVQDSCAIILASNCTDDCKKLCKNVVRLHRACFSPLRVCWVWCVDSGHALRLLALLANYTVVLLQFAFL